MKKILLFSAVLFGAVAASQAGINFNIGFDLPTPPMIFNHPAPVVVAQPHCDPYAVISAPAPVCVPPPQVVYAPRCEVAPAPVIYVPRPVYRYPSYYRGGYAYDGHYGHGRSDWGHSHGNRY